MKRYALLVLSICLMICSCQKEEPTLFVINQTEVTASQIGGLYSISFKSNKSWSAKSSESWCTISPSSGDASIKGAIISMTANDSYDARSSIITITSGGISKTISFTQNAKIALNVTQDKYTLSKEATTIEVEVKANVQFDVIIIGEWITRNTTKSLSQTKLYFNIAKNESYDDRVGSITLKQKEGTFTSTINVLQSQLDAIILTTKSFNLIDTATILSVELSSNVQYVVSIPLVAQSWISQLETKAFIKESLQFRIERNFTNKDRTAQIVVQQPLLKLADTLIIIQDKAPDLPTLTTLDAYDISGYSTKSGGNISKDGGAPILAKGICWDTLENPTIQNFKTDNGLGIGDFTSDIIDLTPATKYYARAYATNRS
ncbi:MAG: BACON domain-containing carbohydrate-binding protein, partial [Bacteroidales bacterium]